MCVCILLCKRETDQLIVRPSVEQELQKQVPNELIFTEQDLFPTVWSTINILLLSSHLLLFCPSTAPPLFFHVLFLFLFLPHPTVLPPCSLCWPLKPVIADQSQLLNYSWCGSLARQLCLLQGQVTCWPHQQHPDCFVHHRARGQWAPSVT